ncbi:MAG: 3-methyl-2-oxobutanoate hydroxymethyltransferase [Chloroflexi bacterium]|nr:3-methyl-2-oxobutanoate hydroxymethyltransferase [Chloroflexota bacterium]
MAKLTIPELWAMAEAGTPLSMITCYDYPSARLIDAAGVDIVLVGDSVAMTVLGHPNTLPATMDMMVIFAGAVARGCERAFVLGDMPYMSYQVSVPEAIRNAGRFMAEAGVDGVKLEGGRTMVGAVEAIVGAGIPVMGHLGLTPQSASAIGGYRVQGRSAATALALLDDALALEDAGVFAILLELVPARVAEVISQKVSVPTISIGSGSGCDGHCQIYHDAIGMFEAFTPRHAKRYAEVGATLREALARFQAEIKDGTYPGPEHAFRIGAEELRAFLAGAATRLGPGEIDELSRSLEDPPR